MLRFVVRFPTRQFARGIYREQMLEKQKTHRIKFRTDPASKINAVSKEELRELKKGEAEYQQFMSEHLQDADIDKKLDNIIDEQIAKGKSDAEILRHLGNVVGVGSESTTRADQEKKERAIVNKITKELKSQGQDPEVLADNMLRSKNAEDFEKFTNKHAQMKFTEHEILYNKWVDDEKKSRMAERKAVEVNKATRKIESTEFGHARSDLLQSRDLRP
jgi:hypothetical protein